MEEILLALSPFIVSGLMALLKPDRINFPIMGYRKTALRFFVALLSFGAVVTGAILSESEVDITSVEVFVESLLTFLGATGVYFMSKKR